MPDHSASPLPPGADPRYLNIRGQRIHTHRALRRFDFTLSLVRDVFLLPAIVSLLVFFSWPLIESLWSVVIQFFVTHLGDGAGMGMARQDFLIPGMTHVPYPLVHAAAPSTVQWWSGIGVVAVLLLAPIAFPPKMLPISYAMRFVGMLQLIVQAYFYFNAAGYPHQSESSIASMMQASMALMLIAPWLFGFTYNIFGFSVWRKLALSLMAVCYLIVLTPFQFTMAALLLLRLSMLWHPLIYLLGTTLLQLISMLALYAWAMSWERLEA